MKKYSKYIFILVALFFLFFIIIFNQFIMKEGNTLDKAKELRVEAADLETKSYEYQNLSNSAKYQANIFLNEASNYEASDKIQKEYEYHIQEKALREEQSRAQAEELRKQEIIDKEIENKRLIADAELEYQHIKNKLFEYQTKAQQNEDNLKQLIEEMQYVYNKYNQTKRTAEDIRKQSYQAQERKQDSWDQVYQNLNNMANNAEMESMLLLDKFKIAQTHVFNMQNEMNQNNEIIRQLEIESQRDEIRNPDIINQEITKIQDNARNGLDRQTIQVKILDTKSNAKTIRDELNKLTQEINYHRNHINETQAVLDILYTEREKVFINEIENWESITQDLAIQAIYAKNKIIDINDKLRKIESQSLKMQNEANNADKLVIELELQLIQLG